MPGQMPKTGKNRGEFGSHKETRFSIFEYFHIYESILNMHM